MLVVIGVIIALIMNLFNDDHNRRQEADIQEYVKEAQEYQDNTFQSHPGYYIDYFEMRYQQCKILHNLHSEMRKWTVWMNRSCGGIGIQRIK